MEERTLLTVQFSFNYSLDYNHFFNTPAKKAVLELAGHLLANRLNDTLSAIAPGGTNTWTATAPNPATGGTASFRNLSVPFDTIVVYAGGRDLPPGQLALGAMGGFTLTGSPSWLTAVTTRGQAGAANGTDIAPWGGTVSFDTAGVNWFFGKTTQGLARGQTDFLTVAMHELAHVLGFGSESQSWNRRIVNGVFTGPNAVAAHGGTPVPLSADGGHWAPGTTSDGGIPAVMDPGLSSWNRVLFTQLDFAGLKDIGWGVTNSNDTVYTAANLLTKLGPGPTKTARVATSIESPKDVDMYRVYLAAGTTLSASVTPAGGPRGIDTYLKLYDLAGTQLAAANQGGVGGKDSLNGYRITRSDYYFVAVSTLANRNYDPLRIGSGPGGRTGSYTLDVSASTPLVA